MGATQDVPNQSPDFAGLNLFSSDLALQDAVKREGGGEALRRLRNFGAKTGSVEAFARGRLANENPPRLETHDDKGRRRDIVQFHPAWHDCMQMSMAEGLHCGSWTHLGDGAGLKAGANVVRAAGSYMAVQMEAGHCCPVTMTNAAVAALVGTPELAEDWLPRIIVGIYDQNFVPPAQKRSVTIGMGMTEKQGGTDVRANTTIAERAGTEGARAYRLSGHKWFLSAPMCDAFLMLAQAPGGLTCFLVPRFQPDDTLNGLHFQRLKDKLGNRSNASAEVELFSAYGERLGEEGKGIATILAMVTYTRLDCAVSSAALMRLGVANALHHTRYRSAFGKPLIEQPLMAAVLADLALESEAATALAFRLAASFDAETPLARAWQRLMVPVAKYWICKTAPGHIVECMECLGGNGYVEAGLLARAYREAPVNAIWEGAGNVMGLDVLRVLMKEPDAAALVLDALAANHAGDRPLAQAIEDVRDFLHRPRDLELNIRAFMEGLARVAAASLLRQHAPAAVADAFLARLGHGARLYGTGLARADIPAILRRAMPDR
jgi:putative acyl-CoA dehydrogenase